MTSALRATAKNYRILLIPQIPVPLRLSVFGVFFHY